MARPGCSRGRARSLPALQAPHLLAQPCLHVDLGSPCGICWGGGGKTTVSFTHRLSKPGAISLGLAEESSTLLELFNPRSAKPLCAQGNDSINLHRRHLQISHHSHIAKGKARGMGHIKRKIASPPATVLLKLFK